MEDAATEEAPPLSPPAAAATLNTEAAPADADNDEAEALRLKSLAEESYRFSDLKSALRHAKKAQRLCPGLDGVSQMVTALRVLRSPPSDHYRTLRLEPFSHINSIKKQYRSLALLLHPDKSSPFSFSGSEEAFKRVGEAFRVLSDRVKRKEYDLKLRVELQRERETKDEEGADGGAVETFWTACTTCRLFHQFDRRYIGQRLLCPSCRKSFLAVEVKAADERGAGEEGSAGGADANGCSSSLRARTRMSAPSRPVATTRSRSSSRPRIPATRLITEANGKRKEASSGSSVSSRPVRKLKEPTLAEMQLEAIRMKAKGNQSKGIEDVRVKTQGKERERTTAARHLKHEVEEDGAGAMAVEDSDFYDFDNDRVEKRFRKGQIWAIYDDDDGMPRHYVLIDEVRSANPFRLKMSWLDLQGNGEESLMALEKTGLRISCGRFKVGKKVDVDSVNLFSHEVNCERAARELYRIYPKKGSVWALYSERTLGGDEERCYDIVVCLTGYSEMHGLSMGYLEKVESFKTIFKRQEIGLHAVKWLEKDDFRLFSHQIPARKLSGSEAPNLPKDSWELDPASLPANLLRTT